MLKKGSIDAVIAVEGKRVDAVAQIADPALHLVPINYDETLQANYLPAQLTSDDYPNLIAKGEQVDTIAATSVLWQFTIGHQALTVIGVSPSLARAGSMPACFQKVCSASRFI